MAGRNNIPLFEMLHRHAERSGMGMQRPAVPPLEPRKAGKGVRHVQIPTYALYIALTLMLTLAIVLWAVAFHLGRSAGEQRTLRRLGLKGDTTPTAPLDPIQAILDDDNDAPGQGVPIQITPADPPMVVLLEGATDQDPRVGKTNYLKLAGGIDLDEATRCVRFLSENGMPTMAVRVDNASGEVKNPPAYSLYALEPVPSSRFGELRPLREGMIEKAARLGRAWRKAPHRGTVDFAQPVWERYDPDR